MKLGPVTNFNKINKTASEKFDDFVMSENFDVIVIFQIYGQFGTISKPVSSCMVCNLFITFSVTFSLTVTFYLGKTENRTEKSLTHLSHLLLVKVLFWPKNAVFFCKKNADISKIKTTLVLNDIFPEPAYVCLLTHQISSF